MAKIRILVVEDEILIAREIEGCLRELGYSVVGIASDAEAALQQIVETQPDLALVDIVIQGEQDGVALAGQVHDRFQIPVVYLTAYVDESTLERAKGTHPFGYILKPFNQRDLRVAIEIALARHQAEREARRVNADGTDPRSFEYLSMLSHELRNPMTTIKVSAAMLSDNDYPLDEAKRQQLLEHIQVATDFMNQLLEDVLTLGQTGYRATTFNPYRTDLVEFCQTLIASFQWQIDSQNVIDFIYIPDQIHAHVDSKLLWHLLSNLLSNALKYSPQGSAVSLRLSKTATTLCFVVQDQGIGIAPEDMEYLFQPFRRGSNVGRLPGTGLGLAIAKSAVERHGGEISVESQLEGGTTFTVTLPLQGSLTN